MAEIIRIYDQNSEELNKLKLACYELEQLTDKGTRYTVEEIYFDLGQGWMYSGIVAHSRNGRHWQAVNPRQYADILLTDNVEEVCKHIVADKYWYDP